MPQPPLLVAVAAVVVIEVIERGGEGNNRTIM